MINWFTYGIILMNTEKSKYRIKDLYYQKAISVVSTVATLAIYIENI